MIPTNEDDLYRVMLIITTGYLVLAYGKALYHKRSPDMRFMLTRLFDGGTLAVSAMVLTSFWHPDVMKLLGSHKPFLMISGMAGCGYAIHALIAHD